MSNLVWRRCSACGQLTLVPATAEACWQCGASMATRPNAGVAGMATEAAYAAGGTSPVDRNLPPPRPRFMDLTPDDDLVARRLLSSVFPDGLKP